MNKEFSIDFDIILLIIIIIINNINFIQCAKWWEREYGNELPGRVPARYSFSTDF